MKRYEPCYNGNGDPAMAESPNGKYYSRADLIAAGCLVPVPDGEATTYWDSASENSVYASAGHLYAEHGELTVAMPITGGPPMTAHTPVQPVRLVPLEDVDVQESEYNQYSHWELSGERPEDHT